MEQVKLQVKLGPLEVHCEASEQFVHTELIDIIRLFSELEIPNIVTLEGLAGDLSVAVSPTPQSAEPGVKLSTTDFAVKMVAKSGSDLVMAAAAYLHHTQGQEEFRRADLLGQMKSAKAFYKASYGSNMTKSLDMLTKSGRLGNPRPDHYSLPYVEIEKTSNLLHR